MVSGAEAAVAKAAIDRLAPSGIEWLKTWWSGKTILVLGPKRAGKTSFLDYLQFGVLRQEQPTPQTLDLNSRNSFIVKLGREGALVLRVWNPLDSPGHVRPIDQVDYVEYYVPDCIILVLDATSPLKADVAISSISWLEEFSQYLDLAWKRSLQIITKLRSVIVILNKWDKLSDNTDQAKDFETAVNDTINQYLRFFLLYHQGTRTIQIKRCALVKGNLGTILIDDILDTLAVDLSR